MTREQKYKQDMQRLGIYDPIFDPEISTLCQMEREMQRAKKEWSRKAADGTAPSVLEDIYAVIQRLRGEILSHRNALGLTPQGLRKVRGAQAEGPDQKDLIAEKLDKIAAGLSAESSEGIDLDKLLAARDAFADMPGF